MRAATNRLRRICPGEQSSVPLTRQMSGVRLPPRPQSDVQSCTALLRGPANRKPTVLSPVPTGTPSTPPARVSRANPHRAAAALTITATTPPSADHQVPSFRDDRDTDQLSHPPIGQGPGTVAVAVVMAPSWLATTRVRVSPERAQRTALPDGGTMIVPPGPDRVALAPSLAQLTVTSPAPAAELHPDLTGGVAAKRSIVGGTAGPADVDDVDAVVSGSEAVSGDAVVAGVADAVGGVSSGAGFGGEAGSVAGEVVGVACASVVDELERAVSAPSLSPLPEATPTSAITATTPATPTTAAVTKPRGRRLPGGPGGASPLTPSGAATCAVSPPAVSPPAGSAASSPPASPPPVLEPAIGTPARPSAAAASALSSGGAATIGMAANSASGASRSSWRSLHPAHPWAWRPMTRTASGPKVVSLASEMALSSSPQSRPAPRHSTQALIAPPSLPLSRNSSWWALFGVTPSSPAISPAPSP